MITPRGVGMYVRGIRRSIHGTPAEMAAQATRAGLDRGLMIGHCRDMGKKLTKAQIRNLLRLAEIDGPVEYTDFTATAKRNGRGGWRNGSHKGLHINCLHTLVAKGLATLSEPLTRHYGRGLLPRPYYIRRFEISAAGRERAAELNAAS